MLFIEGYEGAESLFLQIPGNPDYFLFYPTQIIDFPENMPTVEWTPEPPQKDVYFAYSAEHECSKCTDLPVFYWEKYYCLLEDHVLGGVRNIGIGPVSYYAFINEDLAVALKKAKFTGLHLRSNFFKS